MRRFFITILVVAAFLGGYCLGQQPGSPDLVGWAQRTYPAVAEAFESVSASLSSEPAPARPAHAGINSQTR